MMTDELDELIIAEQMARKEKSMEKGNYEHPINIGSLNIGIERMYKVNPKTGRWDLNN